MSTYSYLGIVIPKCMSIKQPVNMHEISSFQSGEVLGYGFRKYDAM